MSVFKTTFKFKFSYHRTFGKLRLINNRCINGPSPALSALQRHFSQSSDSTVPAAEGRMMKFEEYRKLKKALKWNARIAAIPAGLVAVAISSAANVHFNPTMFEAATPEEIQPILGMDPIVFAALCGVASGIAGFVVGGAFFNTVWKLLFAGKAREIHKRDVDFLARLQRHRYGGLDQNKYEDDYYGDKVLTLSDYRQWIRQQQRKREAIEKLNNESLSSRGESEHT